MGTLEFHPYADLFPMMSDEELDALGADMLEHGQREPIAVFEGMILDGRNRYRACLLKGIEPRFREQRPADPVAFVASANLHRRHLSEAERGLIAARLATMRQGARTDLSPNGEGVSQAKAADLLKVSKRRVERSHEVIDKGVPDLIDAVEHGAVKVSAAAEFVNKVPPLDQARLITEHGSAADAVKATVKGASIKLTPQSKKRLLEMAFDQFKRIDGHGKDAGHIAEPGDSDETIRRRIFLHHASEALRHARENGLDQAAANEITDEIITASMQAAEAWSDLTSALQERKNRHEHASRN